MHWSGRGTVMAGLLALFQPFFSLFSAFFSLKRQNNLSLMHKIGDAMQQSLMLSKPSLQKP